MQIKDNSIVQIHYTLTNDESVVLDSSQGKEPLAYMHGSHSIIPGLEAALLGKTVGDKFNVTIEAADAYGERNPQAVQNVSLEALANVPDLQVGMQLQAGTDQGPVSVTVIELNDEFAVIDGNHPLAGVRLNFAVEVAAVREATESEMSHGHAHAGDGHQH